jgi:hypothetical protein
MIQVYSYKTSAHAVQNDLNNNYPIGTDINCYYEKNNPTNINLNVVNTTVFLAFLLFFVVFGSHFIVFCCFWVSFLLFFVVFGSHFNRMDYH